MKQYIIIIILTILYHFSFSQWVSEEKYKKAYSDIEAYDTTWFEEKIPLLDTVLQKMAISEMNTRKQNFNNSLDTLRKYKNYPDLTEYDQYLWEMRDSLSNEILDSLRLLSKQNYSINRNYVSKRTNAFATIFKHPIDSILNNNNKEFIIEELFKTVFIEQRGYKRHQLYYSYFNVV